jgi:hypothetical protein
MNRSYGDISVDVEDALLYSFYYSICLTIIKLTMNHQELLYIGLYTRM